MLDNPSPSSDAGEAPAALSWQERELIGALRRLANAQSQYGALKEQSDAGREHRIDEADAAALLAIRDEIERTRPKARSRFGGGAARERMAELESERRRLLERMGFATDAEFVAWRNTPATVKSVDPAILHFAQRELEEAEVAWHEIQALEMPEPEAEPEPEAVAAHEPDPAAGHDPLDQPFRLTRPAAS